MSWTTIDQLSLRIQTLSEERFVALCNDILSETAAAGGVPRSCLSLNLNTKEPDGGIDASCTAAPVPVGRLIPRSNVIYQFKSGGSTKTIAKIVETDIVGQSRVVSALRAGSAFVYVTAWDRGERTDESLADETKKKTGIDVDPGQVAFVGREVLAHELLKFPGLVAEFLGVEDGAVYGFSEWSALQRLSNPFQSDVAVESQMADLQAQLRPPRATVRVFGAAGNGKTRLVLEALRTSGFQGSTVYAGQGEDVPPSLTAHLKRTPDIQCTLVVDEVDDEVAGQIMDRFATRPPGLRLILIGVDASRRSVANSLQVPGLSAPLLVATILSILPGLEKHIAEAIAQDCENSPKLAVLIARSIQENPALALATVLTDRGVQNALDAYLPLRINEPDWAALSCASLLMRVGWADEAEDESVRLFRSCGLEPANARRHVVFLNDKFGIAPLGGRFRYVSPAILADHLAARQLESWTRERIADFFRSLTPEMQDSFARRARRLGGVLRNRTAVEEVILGDQGPFRNFADLESGGISFVLRHMAGPFPEGTLRALQRCLGSSSSEQLRAAKQSRRDLVWALQELLWPVTTFEGASRLLLELAVAENETWGNNASGVWAETFQTYLGRTAAGWQSRLRAVQFAAAHHQADARILATRAIEAAFRMGHVSRIGMPPTDVAGMPESEWHPATFGELFDSLVGYLDILAGLTADPVSEVSTAAADVLGELAMEVVDSGSRVFDCWRSIVLDTPHKAPGGVRPILDGIDGALRRWELWLDDEERHSGDEAANETEHEEHKSIIFERLDALRAVENALADDNGFGSRLRDTLSRAVQAEILGDDAVHQIRAELQAYAKEAIEHPTLMERQWDWMLADKEWSRSERWIEYLGEADALRVLQPAMERLATSAERAVGWLSLYEMGFTRASNDESWIERRTTIFLQDGNAAQAFDLLRRTDYSPARYELLREMFASERVPPQWINQIAYTRWIVALSVDEVRGLLRAAKGAPMAVIRTFVSAYVHQHPAAIEALRYEALELLSTADDETRRANNVFDWDLLAGKLVEMVPLEIAELALARIGVQEVSHDIGLNRVLRLAWDRSDKVEFFRRVIAPALTGGISTWWQRKGIGQLPIHELSTDFLLDWVATDPEARARSLADVIGPPHSKPDEIHVQLLERYGSLGVEAEFGMDVMSGTFTGNESAWLRGKLALTERWAQHSSPAIRQLGARLAESIGPQIQRAETEEAEERFR
jgi:hypothetical protein